MPPQALSAATVSAQTDVLMKAEISNLFSLPWRLCRAFSGRRDVAAQTMTKTRSYTATSGFEPRHPELARLTTPPEAAGLMRQIQDVLRQGRTREERLAARKTMTSSTSGRGLHAPMSDGTQSTQVADGTPPASQVAAPLTGDTSSTPNAPTTPERNVRDRAAITDDGGSRVKIIFSDLEIERRIRRSVVTDKTLSTYAHNVKIVATNGVGHAKRDRFDRKTRKSSVAAKAAAVVTADKVTNQIEIAPKK